MSGTGVLRRDPPSTPSAGFSVVEVLVALIVVAVGLLGIAGASAMSVRAANAALRERSAVTRALTRLSLLAATGCARATGGMLYAPGGQAEQWTVGPPANGVVLLEARVEWDDRGGMRSVLLRSAMLC